MSSESKRLEALFSTPLAPRAPSRLSEEATATATEKTSIDEPVPLPVVPPSVHDRASGDRDGDGGAVHPVRSMLSTQAVPAIPVPMADRRGLFSWLLVVPEVDNPYNYSNSIKWMVTSFVAAAACAAPMGTAIFYPALSQISTELHVTSTVVNLSVALFMLSMSIFPLWWSTFSEAVGRRSIYLVSFALNAVFTMACGLSQNITQLIIFRILSGGASASVQAVGAGTIADIWETRERGRAMGIFYLGPLTGPLIAPLLGGALTGAFGWRSTMYFLAAYGALIVVLVLFFVPETLSRKIDVEPATSAPADDNPNNDTLSRAPSRRSSLLVRTRQVGVWTKRLLEPLSIIKFLRFPAVALTVMYAAVTFGSLYVLNICIQSAFSSPPYNYSPLIVGVLYIPGSLGYFIASFLGGQWIDRIMVRQATKAGRYDERGRLIFYPEDRVGENAWLSAAVYPGALIWFGWAVQTHQHWIVPSAANFFFGAGSVLVFSMATTMLTEFLPKRSSSGVALNNFVRNILSATGAVVGQPLINVIGFGWLTTGLAIIALIGGNTALFLIRRNSQKWRKAMNEQLA